ncbi:hypothetical protein COLO4_23172 [Corchorus olitorius]|uniref:Uncharacterized protein n=1 Tax=Corchorus olitorius TaxID=93759 RepID=A0A1R3II03_9ROSI|nr:hypothetical protein COLO4_23172 [Corchorus olitorius]
MESTASKKKKKVDLDLHDDHDDEEEKMEEFYALIKNIRESRDRLMMNRIIPADDQIVMKNKNKEAAADDHDEISNGKNKRKLEEEEEEKQVVVWKPSFQREDFIAHDHDQLMMKKLPHALSIATTASQSKVGITISDDQKEEVKDQGLDLTLSL